MHGRARRGAYAELSRHGRLDDPVNPAQERVAPLGRNLCQRGVPQNEARSLHEVAEERDLRLTARLLEGREVGVETAAPVGDRLGAAATPDAGHVADEPPCVGALDDLTESLERPDHAVEVSPPDVGRRFEPDRVQQRECEPHADALLVQQVAGREMAERLLRGGEPYQAGGRLRLLGQLDADHQAHAAHLLDDGRVAALQLAQASE